MMTAKQVVWRALFGTALALAIVSMGSASGEARTHDASNVARLSKVVDEAYVLGKGDVDWSYAEANLTLEKGDLLRTNETGMTEIQFDANLLMRIGEGSRVALVEMGDEKVVGVDNGRVYLRVAGELPSQEGFFLTFPGGQLFAVGPALVRLDVHEDGGARLRVIRGEMGLVTKPEGARSISAGARVSIDPDGNTQPDPLDVVRDDDFDIWNEQRDIALSTVSRPKQVAADVVGAEDLEDYGGWFYSDTFNAEVWQPYVVDEWKPYNNGRWAYGSNTDWTWVPMEPWGYATHHYGSWNYDPYYGWVWIPGSTWHAARVNWVIYDDYVGWVPVGYYGYPVVTTYPYYVTDYYVDYVDFATFSFVAYSSFGHHHGHHYDRRGHRGRRDGDRRGGRHRDGNHKTIGKRLDTHHKRLTGRQWLDDWKSRNGGKSSPDRRHTLLDGDKVGADKLRNARLRFIRNSDNLTVEKSLRKGAIERRKADHGKIVDLARHPELRKKVARLESDPRRRGKIKAAATTGLPKKAERDNAKRFDFRGSDKMSGKALIEKSRSTRAAARANEGGIREAAPRRSGGGASQYSRARVEFKRRQTVERVKRNRETSPQGRPSVSSSFSVRRIEITDKDLRRTATKFRREDPGRAKTRDRQDRQDQWTRQTTEGIGRLQSPSVRDSRDSIRNRRNRVVKSETPRPAVQTLASRGTNLPKRRLIESARPGVGTTRDRYVSTTSTRARPAQSAWNPRSAVGSPAVSDYRQYMSGTSRARSVRSSGGSMDSGGFNRPSPTRSAQPRMGRPSGSSMGASQSYVNSSSPRRGGGQSISNRSMGRSGGGSQAGGRPARAVTRARARRR